SIRLNLTGKAAGLYFVQVTNENGTYTQKFSLLQ
ncbi:MAG TPA: T9SS type A sorting domain-containing protein, partial [Flavobacteriales bacterium]|nr:T9SS type A sorting domain-containing protein [Flavobacteriales bacterium]